jgi:hypothetical protein
MIRAIPPHFLAESQEAEFCPSFKHPAVAHCTEIWQKIHNATLKKTREVHTAERCAGTAYRLAMPPLAGYENICDFIACTTYGILLGAISEEDSSRLLYAAQVALATIAPRSKTQRRDAA